MNVFELELTDLKWMLNLIFQTGFFSQFKLGKKSNWIFQTGESQKFLKDRRRGGLVFNGKYPFYLRGWGIDCECHQSSPKPKFVFQKIRPSAEGRAEAIGMKFCKFCHRNSFNSPNSDVECIKYNFIDFGEYWRGLESTFLSNRGGGVKIWFT